MAKLDTSAFGDGLAVESRFMLESWPTFVALCAEFGVTFKDIRDQPHLRPAGYDFEMTLTRLKNCHPVFGELKVDQYLSGRMAFELLSVLLDQVGEVTPGWGYTTRADWLLYAFAASEEMLILPMRAAREFILGRAEGCQSLCMKNNRPHGGSYASLCLLMPVRELLRNVRGAAILKLNPANHRTVLHPLAKDETPRPEHLPTYHTPEQAYRLMSRTLSGIYLPQAPVSPYAPAMSAEAVSRAQFSSDAGQKKLLQVLEQLIKQLPSTSDRTGNRFPHKYRAALKMTLERHRAALTETERPTRLYG